MSKKSVQQKMIDKQNQQHLQNQQKSYQLSPKFV